MLSDALERLALKANILAQDISAISHSMKEGSQEQASRKTLEPTTRLRKTAQEARKAQNEDPEIQFIKDQLTDILGG